MSKDRIIAVTFRHPVTLGNQPCDGWFLEKPASSQIAGRVTPRYGDADNGEQRSSVVFEVRLGGANGDVDVEVPAANVASIIRKPPPEKTATPTKK